MEFPRKIAVPLGIVALGFVCFLLLSAMKQPVQPKPTTDEIPLVDVHAVDIQPYSLTIQSHGVSEPLSRTQLIANVGGIVLSYNTAFNAGGMVEKGDILIELEKLDYQGALKSAKANLARAKAGYEEEQARAKVAADDWAREGRADKAPLLGLRKPQLAREKANVLSAEAELDRARRDLARATIRAPYDAIVGQRNVDIGQLVSVGSSLGEILATSIAEVRLPLSLDDYHRLALSEANASSVLLSASFSETVYQWSGTIVRDEGLVDSSNRMLYLVAQVKDPYGLLSEQGAPMRFGTFLQAELQGSVTERVAKIPRTSLVRDEYVYVLDEASKLRKAPVRILGEQGEFVFVESELETGDLVLSSPLPQALPGMEVKNRSGVETADVQ